MNKQQNWTVSGSLAAIVTTTVRSSGSISAKYYSNAFRINGNYCCCKKGDVFWTTVYVHTL